MVLDRPAKDRDDELRDAYELLGVDGLHTDERSASPWRMFGKERILSVETEVRTVQDWVSGTAVGLMANRRVSAVEDPDTAVHLYSHSDGSLWLLDGHHRLASARSESRPLAVMVLNPSDLRQVARWAPVEDGDEDYEDG